MSYPQMIARDKKVMLPDEDNLKDIYKMIKGTYRKELEEFLSRSVLSQDMFLRTCRVIFGFDNQDEDNRKYKLSYRHDREEYHDPSHEYLLTKFLEFINENPLMECAYCDDIISKKKSNTFCGKHICHKCEEFGREVIIKRNMERDLKQWEEKE